jgi:hypothetical protein
MGPTEWAAWVQAIGSILRLFDGRCNHLHQLTHFPAVVHSRFVKSVPGSSFRSGGPGGDEGSDKARRVSTVRDLRSGRIGRTMCCTKHIISRG